MLSRRTLLKRSAGILALTAMGVEIAPAQAAKKIVDFVQDAVPQETFAPYETTWKPVFRQALADDRSICPLHMGSYFPSLNNIHIPAVYSTGIVPTCAVPASMYDNAKGFLSNGEPVLINPASFVKAQGMVHTIADVPHNTAIAPETWRDLASQPRIDINTKRLNVIGEWGLEVSQATTSSLTKPGQIPETPVDWEQWQQAEQGFEIGMINDELNPDKIILELDTDTSLLWSGFMKDVSENRTMTQLCPAADGYGLYYVELQTVFPVVDHRGPVPVVEVWAHIKHVDPRMDVLCGDNEHHNWMFIDLTTLLAGAPIFIRGEAQRRVARRTRIWPIEMEFQPVLGGVSQEQLGQIAVVTIGALVLIALVVVIAGQPQFILIAAVAL